MKGYYYLDVLIKFEQGKISLDENKLKTIIVYSLNTLFGECGSAIEVDVLKYTQTDQRAILRCLADKYVKVRASLSLLNEYAGVQLQLQVVKASASLLSLQSNSRTYKFA